MRAPIDLDGDQRTSAGLRVRVEGELRPPWANWETWDERDLGVEFDLSEVELRAAARALRAEAVRFPPRPDLTDVPS